MEDGGFTLVKKGGRRSRSAAAPKEAATAGFFMSDRRVPASDDVPPAQGEQPAAEEPAEAPAEERTTTQLTTYLEACEELDVTPNSQIVQLVQISRASLVCSLMGVILAVLLPGHHTTRLRLPAQRDWGPGNPLDSPCPWSQRMRVPGPRGVA